MLTPYELFREEKSVSDYVLESLIEKEKQLEELKNMNIKERQFRIFKMFYNGLDGTTRDILNSIEKHDPFILARMYKLINYANEAISYKEMSLYNREEIGPNIMKHYNELLNKISKLSQELNINNSLELSILYSYLLWSGYFSKEKTYKFQSEGRKNIPGLLFLDIMDGIGVCLNNTEMLKDILNQCGYKSCTMSNYLSNFLKIRKIFEIDRQDGKGRKNIIREFINVRKANHAFNLIEEDDKLYIYDSTNLSLYDILNSSHANIINGKGKNILYPYRSYFFCTNEKEVELLDKFLAVNEYNSPYTEEGFRCISKIIIEKIKNNISLIDDFYIEAKSDILGISKKADIIEKKRIIK